ncbi:MAG: hypothetical protein Q7S71_04400 [Candidatus Nitrotoga sp.]|nr:hypothetical protein [Candidatus Nitrotoga sp.]
MSRLNDMTRLRDQIQAGHQGRKCLIADLMAGGVARRVSVGVTRAANQNANEDRSRRLMARLSAFMAALAMQEKGRQKMAARSRKSRVAFVDSVARDVASLARDIASMRNANRAENAASHSAWRGVSIVAASSKRSMKSASHAA